MAMCKLFLLLLLVQFHEHQACYEEERRSLMKIKAYFQSNGYADYFLRPSWGEDNPDCCRWESVKCANTTGHVIELSLGNVGERIYEELLPSMLNQSIFQPFKELRILNLSWYGINLIQKEGLNGLLRLQKLETLDLSGNFFSNNSLQSLSALTSLKKLILNNNYMEGSFPVQELSVLENLEFLDLSDNFLRGSLTMQGSSGLLRLHKLETLDLSFNYISNISLRSLSALTSLKTLILSYNDMEGSFPVQELSVFENLEFLDLSNNKLEGSLKMQDLKKLSKLRKLEYLDLSYNDFDKDIMRLSESLSSLKSLDLSFNYMEGSLSNQDLKSSTKLEILDLSFNNLVGNVPSTVRELASLRALSLAWNGFNGCLPIPGICELNRLQELDLNGNSFEGIIPQCLNNMTSLRLIDLGGNHFEGSFKFSLFMNHPKLKTIMLTCDGDKLKIDAEHLHQSPLFQLETLKLSNCNLKNTPQFLFYQYRIKAIDLSYNNLSGMFPTWLVENNTELELLNLRENSFSGQFHLPANSMRDIQLVDVSSNHFSGQLQDDFGKILSNAMWINLSNNHFEGDFPSSICVTSKLQVLDLSSNNFSGEVPKELLTWCTNLRLLWLSHNKFQGEIFSSHFKLSQLRYLVLRNNQFTGSLSLPNNVELWSLEVFDISNNRIEGEIPSWIGNLTSLQILSLNKNLFEGQFPCKEKLLSMEYLDLSHNFLRGPLPYCFNQNSLKQLNLEGNQFWGSMPSELFNFSALKVLNLKDNNLSGSIPYNINGNLPSLKVLSLGNNYLKGLIPELLCQLTNINTLDLSNNCFSGQVPQCFYNISFGKIEAKRAILNSPEYSTDFYITPPYKVHGNLLKYISDDLERSYASRTRFEFDFVTKNRFEVYKAGFLYLMSGLDLSCNNLTGKIPVALGNLSSIHALNLSHNRLVGPIPISLSKLVEIESLDLSYNYLSGEIPSELTNLVRLEVFNVSHNNLSGKIPSTNQFSTFEESSYEENPLLCGRSLNKRCTNPPTPYLPIVPSDEAQGKWFEVDFIAFYASFGVTYLVFLLGFVTVLFINPFWRRKWFHFVENFLSSSYYFAYDSLGKLWN
ncbi:probably inactive leucine-rich repeat receptor-like protein kinase At3g28040 isoform X1 [Durio zibethinus]|uniref:Probably inactive leucine-rich repeat receptor-like protein kinase At3g28040 isoform X1 n=1 Tax=Durio zibethinus TaxID=66656 RepID=A0A6P5X071_DURZI|nr:probably inactive leucine-rich repeat receptor-like protein kinase At3g28040 isoform X1 [Durio zibethinus]